MIEPTNFTEPEFKSDSENYDLLLEKGISLVQNYSGENWTDYNHHDPGVTLLEQLCYALTDLGYRTNFPIEDLLIGKKEEMKPYMEEGLKQGLAAMGRRLANMTEEERGEAVASARTARSPACPSRRSPTHP